MRAYINLNGSFNMSQNSSIVSKETKSLRAEYKLWFVKQIDRYQDQAARADKKVLKRMQQLVLGQTSILHDSDTSKPKCLE